MSLRADFTARRNGFSVAVRLEIAAGETVALVGTNGAGKSTVLEVLAGLVHPAAGEVSLDGIVLDGPGTHLPSSHRPVGFAVQGLCLFPHLSVLENVAFPLRARGRPAQEARAAARSELQRLGAAGLERKLPGTLSGGEAQRVGLARALVATPRLLLLDEPLTGLDVTARSEIRSIIRSVLRSFDGIAIIVTHEPVDAMTLADRVIILEDGRITQSGSPEEIRAAPRTRYAADLVGLNVFVGRLERLADGSAVLRTEVGDIACPPDAGVIAADQIVGTLRPADVSLHLERPQGSARNVVEGVIRSVSSDSERARVAIEGRPPLVAEITTASLRAMNLAEGSRVWASFKALEVRVVAP